MSVAGRRRSVENVEGVPPLPSIGRWRLSLSLLFLVAGIAVASWVTRTPVIRDLIGASTAEMGLVLLALSGGATSGLLLAGAMVERLGGRLAIACGGSAMVLGACAMGVGASLGSAGLLAVGLAVFGAGAGSGDVTLNLEGASIERVAGITVIPSLHGCYSLGTLAGAGLGIVMNRLHVGVLWHMGAVASAAALITAFAVSTVPRRAPIPDQERGVELQVSLLSVLRERRTLLLCVVILGTTLAEGSATDWLPLLTVDDFSSTAVVGSVVYSVFAIMMTVGRFAGGALVDRVGRVRAVRASALLGLAGILAVIVAPRIELAMAGVVLWGLGAALGFPVAVSAAGDERQGAAMRLTVVTTAGYLALLAGPPVLGLLGQYVGLRMALIVVVLVLAPTVVAAPAFRRLTASGEPATELSRQA